MIIELQTQELEFVRPILRRVANKYRNLLIHRERLSGKLQELRVFARWEAPEDTVNGFYRLDYEREGIRHYIELHISRKHSAKSIAHLFAHELTHMLLRGTGDYVRYLTGEAEIPNCLEESMADNIADFVVSRCRFSDKTCSFMLHRMEDSYCREFAQLLAEGFGSPLEDAKFLDDFVVTDILPEETEAGDPADFWDAYFSVGEATCPVDLWVHNYFWYLSILGRFNEIPKVFDEYMGEGSFAQIRDDMNFYHASVRNGTGASNVERILSEEMIDDGPAQAKQRAFDLLQRFAEIRRKEWEQNNNTEQ